MSQEPQESELDRSRLKIQEDLPIRTVGIETERERTNYGDLPPQNYIHIWWARRPTPATRLAILGSVLSSETDDDTLLRWMGINPDNIQDGTSIAEHVRNKKSTEDEREGLLYEHFGYRKSYKNLPGEEDMDELHEAVEEVWGGQLPTILDATAGGGSIPFESVRYGFPTIANELNPVASVILNAVLKHPRGKDDLTNDISKWGKKVHSIASDMLSDYFPPSKEGREPINYLWANTVTCPDCGVELPLNTNWWIDKDEDLAVRPRMAEDSNEVEFDLVDTSKVPKSEYSPTNGTVSRGKGSCINCHVTIDGDEIKEQAQNGEMGLQLFCVEYRDKYNDSRGNFRSPTSRDIEAFEKAREKVSNDFELSTIFDEERYIGPADRSANYGITKWRDIYTSRQLLTLHAYWKAFEKVKDPIKTEYSNDNAEAILTFLAIAADKAANYNCRLSYWDSSIPKLAHAFSRHDYSFSWAFPEMNLLSDDTGYDWILDSTVEVYEELRELSGHSEAPVEVLQQDAANLSIDSESVDAIVLDPPYYDNVMYAELADFFYVWLKRYLGDVFPEFFQSELTPKNEEAVANVSEFDDISSSGKSKSELAKNEYERKMTSIFEEMYRVLDDQGVFTLMFTHKKTEAWDTLTTALIESGFIVTSTHPISTESKFSLHQAGKNAAESTILLASEKRPEREEEPTLWAEIKEQTKKVARARAKKLDEKSIDFATVDIILASFGPTLEVFTRNYPVIDDEGNPIRPQVALDEARGAVRDYLIEKYLNEGVQEVDPITEWYVLAWLVFEAQRFPYDEANRLGKGLGVEVDDIKRSQRLWRKKSNDVVLRSHDERVQTPADKEKSRTTKPIDPDAITFDTTLDKVHAVMYVYDNLGVIETQTYIKDRGLDSDPGFKATYEALMQVLPPTHDDWRLLRDMALTDVGDLIDLDIDKETFQRAPAGEGQQDKLTNYE